MANHEYGSALDARVLTDSTLDGREEIHRIVDALREGGEMWKNLHVTATADMIGVREGRRIKGLYTLTSDDVRLGSSFDDGICTVTFNTDVHAMKADGKTAIESKYGNLHPPYQIPLRALVSADFDNLLMAGRCISGDFVAHASYRVGGPAFRTGEVAGAYAAYCAVNVLSTHKAINVFLENQ